MIDPTGDGDGKFGDKVARGPPRFAQASSSGEQFDIYLGTDLNDGAWHFVEIDLRARIDALDDDPAYVIDEVNALMVLAEDARIDDLVLSSSKLRAAYQVVPGAQIHAVLGAQSGDEGGACSGVNGAYDRWWYHYNDLGTVLATTKADGSSVGVYIPDFYGNYRTVASGGRPDAMGLTGKFFDSGADLYFFNARWYDPERGRWMSEDPIRRSDSVNLYTYVGGMPRTLVDPTGLISTRGCTMWGPIGNEFQKLHWVFVSETINQPETAPLTAGVPCVCHWRAYTVDIMQEHLRFCWIIAGIPYCNPNERLDHWVETRDFKVGFAPIPERGTVTPGGTLARPYPNGRKCGCSEPD